jgi:hypothetical protein
MRRYVACIFGDILFVQLDSQFEINYRKYAREIKFLEIDSIVMLRLAMKYSET